MASKSARIWIRIRMGPRWFDSLVPDRDMHWDKKLDPDPGSALNLKPLWISSTNTKCKSGSALKVKTQRLKIELLRIIKAFLSYILLLVWKAGCVSWGRVRFLRQGTFPEAGCVSWARVPEAGCVSWARVPEAGCVSWARDSEARCVSPSLLKESTFIRVKLLLIESAFVSLLLFYV